MLSEKDLPGRKVTVSNQKILVCVNCSSSVGPDDYCYGCKRHVCNKCSTNVMLQMNHNVEDHWTVPSNILG